MLKKTESIISRIKKPSEVESQTLSKLFPHTSRPPAKRKLFDPNDECVAKASHSKKKAFKRKLKVSLVNVVLLKKFQPALPKGKERRELSAEGRIQKVTLHRSMTPPEVKSIIHNTFKNSSEFTVLETEGGSKLVRASCQEISGAEAIDRRGSLYLAEANEVRIFGLGQREGWVIVG